MATPLRNVFVGALVGVAVSAAILIWQGGGYWDYSDGVYAMSGRLIADGAVPYRDFVGAQPPVLFGLAGLLVWIDDSVGWLRIALSGVDLALAGLVVVAVRRLTTSSVAGWLAGVGALLTPWGLHEHAQLTPETFAAPLLLGAALLASRRRTAWLAGLLAALATFTKLAFGLPALVLLLTARVISSPRFAARRPQQGADTDTARTTEVPPAPRRRRLTAAVQDRPALWWGAAWIVVLSVASVLLFGTRLIDALFVAQGQSGSVSFAYLGGLWAQAGWNLVVLLLPALMVIPLRGRTADSELLRVIGGLAAGSFLLLLTLVKIGSYLNVLVVIEPPLLVLGAAAITWLVQDWRSARTATPRAALVVCAACLGLWVVQIIALVAKPDDPAGFTRPGSATAHGRLLSPEALAQAVRQARACPGDTPYGGPPAIAFRAERRLPGDQPDPFIVRMQINAPFAAQAAADGPVCVPPVPAP